MVINLQNIEEIIFYDKKVQSLFPEFRHLFEQWKLGKRISGMSSLGKKSVLEVLNSFEKKHILILNDYFDDIIVIDKINHKLVDFYDFNPKEPNNLCKYVGYRDFCCYSNKNQIHLCFWR